MMGFDHIEFLFAAIRERYEKTGDRDGLVESIGFILSSAPHAVRSHYPGPTGPQEAATFGLIDRLYREDAARKPAGPPPVIQMRKEKK